TKGERIRIMTEEKTDLYEVLEANETAFRVNLPEDGKVFVYGREVDDFHTVDYEAIAMLNVSATQEQQKRIAQLEAENASLQQRVAALENQKLENATLQKRLDTLEKWIATRLDEKSKSFQQTKLVTVTEPISR